VRAARRWYKGKVDEEALRRRQRRERLDAAIAAASFGIVSLVVLVFVAVLLHMGQMRSAPPSDTLVVSQSGDFVLLDPALAQEPEAWELEYATCAKLVNYPPRAGAAGARLVPEVSRGPVVSHDGLTYRFDLRRGWRFSNGERVTAAAFARSLERARSPGLFSPAEPYLREVESWRASGMRLTIRLSERAPDFLERLALPYFCAVPPDTPDRVVDAIPSAGPFYVSKHVPNRSLTLLRNPYYGGARHARVDRIVYRFGALAPQIGLQLVTGEADYGVVPPSVFASFAVRPDSGSLFRVPQPIVGYLALNTQRPLFRGNPQLRRAVNFAIDRPALARAFGMRGTRVTDQYLPPGFPGYRDARLYPLAGPDLATARRLAAGRLRGGHVVYLACPGSDCRDRAVIVAKNLERIGLHVDIRSGYGQYALAGVKGTAFDIVDVVVRPDYADPYGLVEKLLDGRAIRSVGNTNLSYFADRAFSRELDRAQRLTGGVRIRAYSRLDVEVARDDAPLAAYANVDARVFLAKRVGCITYQPEYGLDIAGLCLRDGGL
jgi:peptide/nickel transport system substrate-binding protein